MDYVPCNPTYLIGNEFTVCTVTDIVFTEGTFDFESSVRRVRRYVKFSVSIYSLQRTDNALLSGKLEIVVKKITSQPRNCLHVYDDTPGVNGNIWNSPARLL